MGMFLFSPQFRAPPGSRWPCWTLPTLWCPLSSLCTGDTHWPTPRFPANLFLILSPLQVSPPFTDYFILEFLQRWSQVPSSSHSEPSPSTSSSAAGFRFHRQTDGPWIPPLTLVSSSFTPSHYSARLSGLFLNNSHPPQSHLHPEVLRSECQGGPNPGLCAYSSPPDSKPLENILWHSSFASAPGSHPAVLLQYSKGVQLTWVSSGWVKIPALQFSCWTTTGLY